MVSHCFVSDVTHGAVAPRRIEVPPRSCRLFFHVRADQEVHTTLQADKRGVYPFICLWTQLHVWTRATPALVWFVLGVTRWAAARVRHWP